MDEASFSLLGLERRVGLGLLFPVIRALIACLRKATEVNNASCANLANVVPFSEARALSVLELRRLR